MSDEIDKFVLSYSVDLKDSVSRLEKLQEKMNGVQKGAASSAKDLKGFATDASSELGKLVPGLNAVSDAVRSMGAEFAGATAALAALAVGVKLVMNLRDQYNAQRSEGMQLGVSSIRLEEYTRKFAKGSGGMVGRDAAVQGIRQFSDMANTAYTDPSRLGREARIMRMLGVNVGERGQMPTGFNTELTQLATGLQGKSRADVQGIAKATGMSQDWLLTLQRLGPAVGKITEMTGEEIEKRQSAEANLAKFNDQLGQLKENFVEVSNALAEPLLPLLNQLVEAIRKITDALPKPGNNAATKDATAYATGQSSLPATFMNLLRDRFGIGKGGDFIDNNSFMKNGGLMGLFGFGNAKTGDEQKKQAAKKEQDERTKAVEKMDEANKQGLQTANQMALAVNMFSGAVQAFSSSINLQQAWAAWAGEIGRVSGLPGSSGQMTGGGNGNWRSSQYATQIQAASAKTGMDPQMLYAIMHTESHGDPNAVSPTGAGGLMQITRGNRKAYGLTDYRDPAANIMVGAQIYAAFLRKNNGDISAALRGYNGNSDPDYVSKITGAYGGAGIGESRAKMNMRSVQQSIADYLHVPLQQVQRGGVTTSDAGWASRQIQAGLQNGIFDLQRQLSVGGMPAQNYAKLQFALRDQSRGLDLMRQYGGDVIGRQQQGTQTLTIGERAIAINVSGAQDPKAVAAEVNNQLTKSMNDLLYQFSTGLRG